MLLEAMTAGVPIIATAVGGVPEIVEHNESALLVEPRRSLVMAQAIALVLSDVQLARKLVTKARTMALSRHTPESRLQCLIEMYCELIPNRVVATV